MFEGPFKIIIISDKQVWVSDGQTSMQFNCTQVFPDPANIADLQLARRLKGFQYSNIVVFPLSFVTYVVHLASTMNNYPPFTVPKAE